MSAFPIAQSVEDRWDTSPFSREVLQDRGPWTRYVSELWRAMADLTASYKRLHPAPDAPTEEHIAYWSPLLALTYGALGWGRPDIGVARWLEAGMPANSPATVLLRRCWGENAVGLVMWSAKPSMFAAHMQSLADHLELHLPPAPAPRTTSQLRFPRLTEGGSDPLHLEHVHEHLVADAPGGFLVQPWLKTSDKHAVLLLDQYDGWYRQLHLQSEGLAERGDGRSWQVEVVVRAVGSLGVYRLSKVTGRWFTGKHSEHMMGQPG